MDNVIIHNNKKYSVDEIKKDFDVISEYMSQSYANTQRDAFNNTHKTMIRCKYNALKYVFCNLVNYYDYDEKSRLIFRANEICKKYVTNLPKRPSQPTIDNGRYARLFHNFQTKVMLDVEDFVIAYANPEWSEIYLQCVPCCNKKAHLAILHSCEAQ